MAVAMNSIANGKQNIPEIVDLAARIRKNILDLALYAGSSSAHIGGALSIADISAVLFGGVMNFDASRPEWSKRDRFILSKGHACLAYYAALCEVGYISREEFRTFEKTGSRLLGHPVMDRRIGIEFSTGSLGMGLGLGIGVAIAVKKRNLDSNVFVILGDGECNEGSVWESAMAAAHYRLTNLTVIVDKNNYQQTGTSKEIMDSGDLKKKWEGFGWEAVQVDGHKVDELLRQLSADKKPQKPFALIANTVKGKGVSFLENNNEWHHAMLTQKLYDSAISEL